MDYWQYTSFKTAKVVVGEKIFEYEGDTWQICNLIQISLQQKEIPFESPEPEFNDPFIPRLIPPKQIFQAVMIVIAGILAAMMLLSKWVYVISVLAAITFILKELKKNQKRLELWQQKKEDHKAKHAYWLQIKTEPQIIYFLSVDPNTRPNPLFYSYDGKLIKEIVDTIKKEIKTPTEKAAVFNIKTIQLEPDQPLSDFAAQVYEKAYKMEKE